MEFTFLSPKQEIFGNINLAEVWEIYKKSPVTDFRV